MRAATFLTLTAAVAAAVACVPAFSARAAAPTCSTISTALVKSALGDLVHRNAKIVGVVLNAVKAGQPGYYSKYRYKEYSTTSA